MCDEQRVVKNKILEESVRIKHDNIRDIKSLT